ncbi:MAG: flagellar basal body-associated FliL family protein [Armatimonadia bacterium]
MTRIACRTGKLMIIAVICAGAVGVVGGIIASPKLLKHKPSTTARAEKTQDHKERRAEARETRATRVEKDEVAGGGHATIVPLGDFLVNLDAGSSGRYLRAEVAMALVDLPEPKKGGHGGGKGPAIPEGDITLARDRVVAVLSAGDFVSLKTAAGKDKLKARVLDKLSEALPQYDISEVLFTSFVMQ